MIKIAVLIALLSTSIFAQDVAELDSLLQIKPGAKVAKKISTSGSTPKLEYEISFNKDLVESIRIDFNSPIGSQSIIEPETKGHCLIQTSSGSVVLPHFYFFDTSKHRRYELTPNKEIKSILIQKIPGARENPPCLFKDFVPAKALAPDIKKVK